MKSLFLSLILIFSSLLEAFAFDADKYSINISTNKDVICPAQFTVPVLLVSTASAMYAVERYTGLDRGIRDYRNKYIPNYNLRFDDYLQYAPAVVTFSLSLSGVKARHSSMSQLILYSSAMAASSIVVTAMKYSIRRMRPDYSSRNSFPSGHTATAFVAAEFMRREYGDISPYYTISAYLMATLTAVSRIANNRHWFTDVLAGAGIGIASTTLSYALYDYFSIRYKKQVVIVPQIGSGLFALALTARF